MGLESQEAFARPCRALALLAKTPQGSATGSQTRFCATLLYFCRVPNSLQTLRPHFPSKIDIVSTSAFPEVGEASQPRTDPGNFWASSRNSLPPTSANLRDPTLWPTSNALREVAATDALRVLSFYFRSPFSAAGKTAKENVGQESGCFDKIAETLRLSQGTGDRSHDCALTNSDSCRGGKDQEALTCLIKAKKRDL